MDPTATLLALRAAITELDLSAAVHALNDYYRWRLQGGFEPRVALGPQDPGAPGDWMADREANRLARIVHDGFQEREEPEENGSSLDPDRERFGAD